MPLPRDTTDTMGSHTDEHEDGRFTRGLAAVLTVSLRESSEAERLWHARGRENALVWMIFASRKRIGNWCSPPRRVGSVGTVW